MAMVGAKGTRIGGRSLDDRYTGASLERKISVAKNDGGRGIVPAGPERHAAPA